MPAPAGRGRSPPCSRNTWFKIAYFVSNLVGLSILYSNEDSILYVQNGKARDAALEFWLWAAVGASWIAYLLLQGSSPGYLPAKPAGAVTAEVYRRVAAVERETAEQDAEQLEAADAAAIDVATEDVGSGTGVGAVHHSRGRSRERRSVPVTAAVAAEVDGTATAAPAAADADAAAREVHHDDHEHVDLLGRGEGDSYHARQASDPVGAAKEATAQAVVGARECKWCHAEQLPRAHHCRECDRCVATYDHHCGVLNTCIGERNRSRFWWYLATQMLSLAFWIGILNTGFVYRRQWGEWVGANAVAIIALIVMWICQLFVLILLIFHTWLALTNTTTYETSSGPRKLWYLAGTNTQQCDLPYSKGTCTNLRLFCCVLESFYISSRLDRALPWCKRRGRGAGGGGEGPEGADGDGWAPQVWQYPGTFDRDSPDVWNNIWENRYWACC